MRQRAAASLLYQSKYAEAAFRNLLKLIFLKIVGRILAFYNRPTTVAFVLTRAFFSAFLNYNIDNVYLGDMRLKHIDLTVNNLVSNGDVVVTA